LRRQLPPRLLDGNVAARGYPEKRSKNRKSIPVGVSLALDGDLKSATDAGDSSGSHVDVFKAPVTRRRMVAMACIWLACAMVYDGLNLNVGNLVTNLYLSVFLNGIAELPTYFLKAIIVDKFEMRAMLIFLKNRGAGVRREVVSGLKRGCITWMRFLQNEEAIQGGGSGDEGNPMPKE
jgi:hypothetical protein